MDELISRKALLRKYDKAHEGPPGGARKLIEEEPAVEAIPVYVIEGIMDDQKRRGNEKSDYAYITLAALLETWEENKWLV